MNSCFRLVLISFLVLICISNSKSLNAQTVVTTYVVKTQTERKSTRFTLTEWLRIKERMKLMDVWLAMFGPQKDEYKFKPEFNINLQRGLGSTVLGGQTTARALNYQDISTKLWLNNLISSTTGVRLVNIDFGLEVSQKNYLLGSNLDLNSGQSAIASDDFSSEFGFRNSALASFRLFGRSIQDSSLVLKYGGFQDTRQLSELAGVETAPSTAFISSGTALGGDLELYFNHWFGISYNYMNYSSEKSSESFGSSTFSQGGIFIEISLLRVSVGRYDEVSNWTHESVEYDVTSNGTSVSMSLFL